MPTQRFGLLRRTVLLAGIIAALGTPTARAQPGSWRDHVHIGPDPNNVPGAGPGSFNLTYPTDYGPYPAEWYHWPSLREALDQYGWFGRHGCQRSPAVPVATLTPEPLPAPIVPGAALIRVIVPPDAVLWIDGNPTTQTGPERLFVTPPLEAQTAFLYEIRARWRAGNTEVSRKRTARVWAGDRITVDFGRAAMAADSRPAAVRHPTASAQAR